MRLLWLKRALTKLRRSFFLFCSLLCYYFNTEVEREENKTSGISFKTATDYFILLFSFYYNCLTIWDHPSISEKDLTVTVLQVRAKSSLHSWKHESLWQYVPVKSWLDLFFFTFKMLHSPFKVLVEIIGHFISSFSGLVFQLKKTPQILITVKFPLKLPKILKCQPCVGLK